MTEVDADNDNASAMTETELLLEKNWEKGNEIAHTYYSTDSDSNDLYSKHCAEKEKNQNCERL